MTTTESAQTAQAARRGDRKTLGSAGDANRARRRVNSTSVPKAAAAPREAVVIRVCSEPLQKFRLSGTVLGKA